MAKIIKTYKKDVVIKIANDYAAFVQIEKPSYKKQMLWFTRALKKIDTK